MDFSGRTATRLRSFGRRLGILPPLVRAYRRLSRAHYEERFERALLGAIRPGDTVWDVGANLGLYTDKFAKQAGQLGRILAFEPSPRNVAALRARFADAHTVTICAVALAEQPGTATFYENGGHDGTTDSLVLRSADAVRHEVEVHRGDEYLPHFPPDVIKIDVEGFELEVLQGLDKVLSSSRLRSVLIEVHFGILSDRGLAHAPAELTTLLRKAKLVTSWVDSSHLIGERKHGIPADV